MSAARRHCECAYRGRLAATLRACFAGSAALICLAAGLSPATSFADAGKGSYGLSAFGTLKYPANFKHFDYVDPRAPKGGKLSLIGTESRITFDSFNAFIVRGDAAQGLQPELMLVFDSLMARAWDEPDSYYGLVAKSVEVAPDRSTATFHLRPEARFSDGSPLTAEDVVFSFNAFKKKSHPRFRLAVRFVERAERVDKYTVRYHFGGERTRDLPLVVAQLPIFSKAFYSKVDFQASSLVPPIGSGPYEIGKFEAGRFNTFVRRKDYWAKDLPVNVGRFNFDEIRFNYYRDRTLQLEALKAGAYDLREEFTSRDWATAYNIAAVKEGRLKRELLPDHRPSGTQGFFLNLRRKKFQDIRLRKALDLAFDFEWTRKNLFYGAYHRTNSYFENSEMRAEGPPSAGELKLLAPYRDRLPAAVFAPPYISPVRTKRSDARRYLRQASKLLKDAGWIARNGKLTNEAGEALNIEFLIYAPGFERIIAPYVRNLKRLGIEASIRLVDPAQYERRRKSYDFDIIVQRYTLRLTPGPELRAYWGSEAAKVEASFNLSGISNPVVDALIEKIIAANNRRDMVTAARALDRVLRAGHYWVPHWYNTNHRMAYWDKFSRPKIKPRYHRGVITTWWYDGAKAARLNR